jgi:hypothetical protein
MNEIDRFQAVESGQCFLCKEKMTTILKLTDEKITTKNHTKICQNKHCAMFIIFENLENWVLSHSEFLTRKTRKYAF